MGLTPAELDDLTARHLALGAQIETLTLERAVVEAKIRDGFDAEVETVAPNGAIVKVYRQRRFDEQLARQVLPAEVLPLLEKRVLDARAVKANVAPALYAACQKESDTLSVRVR